MPRPAKSTGRAKSRKGYTPRSTWRYRNQSAFKPYNNRRVYPSVARDEGIYSCCISNDYLVTGGGGPTITVYDFRVDYLSSVPVKPIQQLLQTFQQYRIDKIEFIAKPNSEATTISGGGVGVNPIRSCLVTDANSAPANITDMQGRNTFKETEFNMGPHRRTIYPKLSLLCAAGASVAHVTVPGGWISTNDTLAEHYGLAVEYPNLPNGIDVNLQVKYYLSFKNTV